MSSPLTWGTARSAAATYGRPGEARFGNEFVLRFSSVAAAHRAVVDASRQFRHCHPHLWGPPIPGGGWHLSEYVAVQSGRFAARQGVNTRYSLRVARRQNVVVVVETRGVDDRAAFVLSVAMARATGDMRRERALLAAVGPGRTTGHTRHRKPAHSLYANCDEAEAADAAPSHRAQPGYGPERDGLGDGVACVS